MIYDQFPYSGLSPFETNQVLFHAYIPTDEHIVKKNNKTLGQRRSRSGRLVPFIRSTQKQKSAEERMVLELRSRANDHVHNSLNGFPITDPVWCVFNFFYNHARYYTRKNQRSLTLPDLSNLYELPQDALQKAGILKNDHLIRAHDFSRILPHTETALEIWILPYQAHQDAFLMAKRMEHSR